MIAKNIDVINSLANGTVGKFQRIKLANDHSDIFKINIDGYYINCVKAENVEYIELQLEDKTLIKIKPEEIIVIAEIPIPEAGCIIKHNTQRDYYKIKLTQFPAIACNSMTVHKLQGKSLDYIFVSEWCYSLQNLIYVLLSRLRTSSGLYIRHKLIRDRCKPMSKNCKLFLKNKSR